MLKLDAIDETISKYYDSEMNISELMSYEARLANSNYVKDYSYQKCFEYYKISSSIKQTKKRVSKYCALLTDELLNKNKDRLFFDFYPVFLKSIYKKLRSLSLNALRDNSKQFNGF